MSRTLRPWVALALVALIGLIGAGCGANASSESGTTSSSGCASGADTGGDQPGPGAVEIEP